MNKQNNHVDIKYLEIINEVIDLCIDSESYKYLDQIIILKGRAKAGINALLKKNQSDKDEDEWEKVLKRGFQKFPVKEICLPIDLVSTQLLPDQDRTIPLDKSADQTSLLKLWSHIFWSKRLRAIILEKNNKGIWLKRYEEILLLLERHSYDKEEVKGEKDTKDYQRTKINYLMELSAAAQGEASLGYAERARDVLNKLYKDHNDPERGFYDRWISWNKGTAYQHSGRNQKAVLEFNWVIKKFWHQSSAKNKKQSSKNDKKDEKEIEDFILRGCRKDKGARYFAIVLEFLTNIVPAYLQRAAINLKFQLGYHARQTLNDKDLDNLLDKIIGGNVGNILHDAAFHLQQRIELLRIEALLQLEQLDDVQNKLEKTYQVIFSHDSIPEVSCLPKYKTKLNPKAIQIQLVEQIVSWLLAREREEGGQDNCEAVIADLINSLKTEASQDEIGKKLLLLKDMAQRFLAVSIEVKKTYWSWVKDNQFDELIYFSRWAQFLKQGSGLLKKLRTFLSKLEKITPSEDYAKRIKEARNSILEAIITLYCARRQKLPLPTNKTVKHKEILKLERFRSDDRPDFISGLSAFYKEMSTLFRSNNVSLKKAAQEIFKREKVESPFKELRDDHFNVLAALDEFESEFGENQQIGSLKRCNERLIWEGEDAVNDCEKHCISTKNGLFAKGSFWNLLKCSNARHSIDKCEFELSGDNYEKIMKDAEEHFKKHLKSNSYQSPQKEALHFLGLQRWNSLTPAQGRSIGGGYFLYRTDKKGVVDLGIAIDPGFDFVRNLFRMGFSLRDVDIVLISHAHPDHLWDFESMVQLLHELKDKEQITKRLNVIFTLGSYRRLEHIINNPVLRGFINPLVIDIRKEIDPHFFDYLGPDHDGVESIPNCFNFRFSGDNRNSTHGYKAMRWEPVLSPDESNNNESIKIWPTRAYHDDYSDRSDSFGFIIQFSGITSIRSNKSFSFGYTGDTKWVGDDLYNQKCPIYSSCEENYGDSEAKWKNVATQYKNCDVLLLHLGSLIEHNQNDSFASYTDHKKCAELVRKKNHPYLIGMIRLLRSLYNECCHEETDKLLLLSEFGEELRGGIRIDLIKRFQNGLIIKDIKKDWRILPVDVGLDILLHDYTSPEKQKSDQHKCRFKFLCVLCDKFCSINEVEYTRFGHDEAIFHICKTCDKAEPFDVRQTKLRQLYEIGRELRTLPDSFD